MDPVYWRILIQNDGTLIVVEMQAFDESDYTNADFLTTTTFTTEADANDVVRGIYYWHGRYRV